MRRVILATLSALATAGAPLLAQAGFESFNRAAYEAKVQSNAPVVVHTHEWWCSTCRAQAAVLEKLQKEPKYAKVTMFRASHSAERETLAPLKVTSRSIIIVFAGGKQVGRLDWVTDESKIRALLDQAIAQAGG